MGAKGERVKRTRTGIDRSLDEGCLVRVTRRLGAVPPVDGVVVARGVRWVLLARLSTDLDLDGYTAVRWKQIKKVQPFDPESVPARATALAEVVPVPTELVDTTTTGSLLRSVSRSFAPVRIRCEGKVDTACEVGVVVGVVDKSVQLARLGPGAVPSASPVVIAFESITRIDFDGRYFRGLARAADRPAKPPTTVPL